MNIPRHLTVLSPHLDDAVFSCGMLIAAAPHATVVTVFAGMPDADSPAQPWDRAAGFADGAQAVATRREEDARALALLGARPHWLDFLDAQYGVRYRADELAAALRSVLDGRLPDIVAVPMGLFHSDHVLVHEACMLLRAQGRKDSPAPSPDAADPDESGTKWLFYEDAIYRRLTGLVQRRLAHWLADGLLAEPVCVDAGDVGDRKARACDAYASQIALFDAHRRRDLAQPERYWRLRAA